MTATACQEAQKLPSAAMTQARSAAPVLQSQEGRRRAAHAARMREAKAELRSVSERDYVQAIDRWLNGGPWEGRSWFYTSGRGLIVRLLEDGDDLTQDGVTIVSRDPARIRELPSGTRTSRRLEARALAAVAVRGDASWYDARPT